MLRIAIFVLGELTILPGFEKYTDNQLVNLIIDGDHAAFKSLFLRYYSLLFSHAHQKLQDREEAKDVVQEVLTKVWIRRHQLIADSNIAGFLFTAVRNQIFDLLRHKKHMEVYRESFQSFEMQNYVISDQLARERQLSVLIEREIAALPPRMRQVFELRKKEYLTNKEIAERMNISEATVAVQMKRALRQLKLKLGWLTVVIWALMHRP